MFPKFLDLPAELQNMIWEMAIRSNKPGAHFFTIRNGPRAVYPIWGPPIWGIGGPIRVAPPVSPSVSDPARGLGTTVSHPPSNVISNPSAYAIDSGLWTACRNSRSIMKGWMNSTLNDILRDLGLIVGGVDFAEFDTPCSMTRSGNRTYVVFHRKDLFFFQQENDESLDWQPNLWHWFSLMSSRYLTYDFLANWAFEFDETWAFDMQVQNLWDVAQENNHRGLFLRMLIIQHQRFQVGVFNLLWPQFHHSGPFKPQVWNLYLLDSAVQLGPDINTEKKETFQGNGCKYVVCQESDVDMSSGNYSVFDFMKRIDSWIAAHSPIVAPLHGPVEPYIKVLARLNGKRNS
ncbi:hypothetical protein CSOJ01_14000 [Colletotrichum sojae]|uniref:2EXR domain-containing protein n=1 Tax=Colletotrichum sojae TaxID=2175907 RepID=A0A8H6IQX1_9PEZI|nr:hypothetical protein CSOJ01_14000 [Colletotrichum sojae]